MSRLYNGGNMSNIWKASYSSKDVEIISETVKYDGHFKVLHQKIRFRMFSGAWSSVLERDRIHRKSAAAVLLYKPEDDQLVMVEQFRSGALHFENESPWMLEPVAGLIEEGDSPIETVKREAVEESGCIILDLVPICRYLASSGISNEATYLFCGRIKEYQAGALHGMLHEAEDIKVHALSPEEAFQLLDAGKIFSASAIIALQWLKLNLEDLRKK